MNFNKKINYNDDYYFKPDNQTVGTFEYWKRKFGDKFDDATYVKWEAYSRLDGIEREIRLQEAKQMIRDYNNKLMQEIEERLKENLETNNIENEQVDKLPDDKEQSNISELSTSE